MKKVKWKHNYTLLVVLAVIVLVVEILSGGKLLRAASLTSMLGQIPELGIISIGMFAVILTAGIDLSITYLSALSGVCTAFVLSWGKENNINLTLLFLLAVLTALAVALIGGALNGIIVSRIGVHPVLATIGTYTLFFGIANVLTKGSAISRFPKEWRWVGKGELFGIIPVPSIIFVFVIIIAYILLNKTIWGRSVYMIGSNKKVAEYSGIDVKKINFRVYLFAAMLAGIAAVVMTGRYSSGKADLGSSYLLQSVSVAVLGGTNMAGGEGSLTGVVIATIIIQVISTGVTMIGLSSYFVDVLVGVILLIVLVFGTRKKQTIKA